MSAPLTRFEQLNAQHRADAASPDRALWSRPYAWYAEQACNEVDELRARVAELERQEQTRWDDEAGEDL